MVRMVRIGSGSIEKKYESNSTSNCASSQTLRRDAAVYLLKCP